MNRRTLLFILLLCCMSCFFLVIWPFFSTHLTPKQKNVRVIEFQQRQKTRKKGRLRLLTLNLAHGRGIAFHQALLSRHRIEKNLKKVVSFLKKERPDVVALQEADGASWWSGRFHHVRFIAKRAGFRFMAFGPQVNKGSFHYGVALLSRVPLRQALSFRFSSGFPLMGKGFVMAELGGVWTNKKIDVYSLHFDPLRASIRRKQLAELRKFIQKRGRQPLLLGDFNVGWSPKVNELQTFVRTLNLNTYSARDKKIITFPSLSKRLDWIFWPNTFVLKEHKIANEILSDHQAVICDLKWVENVRK